jgi:iron(III) transport system ATP-binding protein
MLVDVSTSESHVAARAVEVPAPAVAPLMSARQVTKRYGRTTALDRVDLDVVPGETLSVVGPSGSGKSTLLRVVAGLVGIEAGTVTLAGQEVNGPNVFVPAEHRGVGIVFQDLALFPHLCVADNIAFGLRHGAAEGGSRGGRRQRVEEMLRLVGLSGKASRFPHELSGGEQQRVAIGRALALDPSLVLLDEPFSHLDTQLAVAVRNEAMEMLRSAGATVVLVTHDQDEAMAVADRVAVMQEGRLVQVDTPAVVFHEPVSEFAASFLGEADFLAGTRDGSQARTALGVLALQHAGPSGPVRVMLRPHLLTAVPPETGRPGAAATVVHVEFRGGEVLHVLRLESGETLRALLPHTAALRPGDRAVVAAPEGVRLVAFDD